MNFDDNAEFRQKEVFKFRDRSQEDPREVEASKHDLNYIGLTGEYCTVTTSQYIPAVYLLQYVYLPVIVLIYIFVILN